MSDIIEAFFDTKTENVVSFPASGLNSSPIKKYSTLYNLQLPVSINYHLNKHWQASAGLKLYIPLQQDIRTSTKSNITFGYRPVNRIANQAKKVQKTTAMNINIKTIMCGIARIHLTSGFHLFRSFLTSG